MASISGPKCSDLQSISPQKSRLPRAKNPRAMRAGHLDYPPSIEHPRHLPRGRQYPGVQLTVQRGARMKQQAERGGSGNSKRHIKGTVSQSTHGSVIELRSEHHLLTISAAKIRTFTSPGPWPPYHLNADDVTHSLNAVALCRVRGGHSSALRVCASVFCFLCSRVRAHVGSYSPYTLRLLENQVPSSIGGPP